MENWNTFTDRKNFTVDRKILLELVFLPIFIYVIKTKRQSPFHFQGIVFSKCTF